MPSNVDRWPGHPAMLTDECLSSWFYRTAIANGLIPFDLYKVVQPLSGRYLHDVDRHADSHLLGTLSARTGASATTLADATFRRWAGWLFERDDGRVKLDWLPPTGRHEGARYFGQQLCPQCLSDDVEPYLRLTWRLSFVAVCASHQRLLLDRCPACEEPFNSLKQQKRSGGFTCWSCGSDARGHTGDVAPVDFLPIQDALLATTSRGWSTMGQYGQVYSFVFLEILALLARLLSGGVHAYPLRQFVVSRTSDLNVAVEAFPRVRDFAALPPRARSILIAMSYALVQDWPDRFIEAANAVGLTRSHIRKRHDERMPFAFSHVVDWHLTQRSNTDGLTDSIGAKNFLIGRGLKPTYGNIRGLVGTKLAAMSKVAEPAIESVGWGSGRFWKLDGVSPEVRAAVRDKAHRAGESVGPWLDSLLRRCLDVQNTNKTIG